MRGHMVAAVGEFVGIFMWLFFAYGSNIVAANQASAREIHGATNTDTVMFVAMAYAFPLMVYIWASMKTSGGHLNPAVRCHDFIGSPV
jgi:aquaporin rerated protein, other eukaryote